MNCKIRIENDEHSEQVQNALFELGCRWSSGYVRVQHLSWPAIYVRNSQMTYDNTNDPNTFERYSLNELTLEDLKEMLTNSKPYVEFRRLIHVKFLPTTNTKPNRYKINTENYPSKIMSRHLVENVDFPNCVQALVEIRLKELELEWEICSAGILPDGSYVFIVK